MNDYFIQLQTCNLADSLLRNINNNFRNISFDVLNNGYIQVKIILKVQTEIEDDYIEDISVEFSSIQEQDIVEKFEVTTDKNAIPRKHIVFCNIDF